MTVNTRVTKEIRDRARTAASALGWVPADVYRAAFAWWLDCYESAGGREPSDIERAAALSSIKLAHGRMAEVYEACRIAGIRHVGISVATKAGTTVVR